MVGHIGTVLGEGGVNISTMQVARDARGGDALMVLEIDRQADRALVDRLAAIAGVSSIRHARL
jgi:D-3-phosphoglycerate dehydrogenase